MIVFSIQMDEERILKDGFLNLDAVWKCIEATFAQRDVTLYARENDVRYYSRNIDKHDFEYQWMVHSVFQDEDWFQYYVKSWRFYEIDDDTYRIETEEDLRQEDDPKFTWVRHPKSPLEHRDPEETRKKAEEGDAIEQYYLATMYEFGDGVSQDQERATRLYWEAACGGVMAAKHRLAERYYKGIGIDVNYEKAYGWFERAVRGEKEYPFCYYRLGEMCQQGIWIEKNLNQAITWYEKSAAEGYGKAALRLGEIYERGEGMFRDCARAVDWYRRAAELGKAEAMERLAVFYERGMGVEQDLRTAIYWYRQAAFQRNLDVKPPLDAEYILYMAEPELCEAPLEWYVKEAIAKYPYQEARIQLGKMYELGYGVEKNLQKALEWYTLAAKDGYVEAQYYLGELYAEQGEKEQAVRWWALAGKKGHGGARGRILTRNRS